MIVLLETVDPIEVSLKELTKRLDKEPVSCLEDAVTTYGLAHFSRPCLSTLRHLVRVGNLLHERGKPEYLQRMRQVVAIEGRCNADCCRLINHSAIS